MVNRNSFVYQNIKRSFEKDRLTHAYLFVGEQGTNKLEMALEFVKLMYCKEKDPCGVCASCKQIDNMTHPNLFYIKPDGQTIKKESVEKLQEEFNQTPLVSGHRVYIIDGAEKMTSTSANRLLKFIEEPLNSGTIGILLSENLQAVLPTITSRCQVILFPSVKRKELYNDLINLGYDSYMSNLVSYVNNSKEEAISYLEGDVFSNLVEYIIEMGTLINANKSITLFFNDNANTIMENSTQFLKLLITFFMDVIYYKNGINNIAFNNHIDLIDKLSKKIQLNKLVNAVDVLLECSCREKIYVNQFLMIERALLEIEMGESL